MGSVTGIMLANFLSNVAISRGSKKAGLLPWEKLKAFLPAPLLRGVSNLLHGVY